MADDVALSRIAVRINDAADPEAAHKAGRRWATTDEVAEELWALDPRLATTLSVSKAKDAVSKLVARARKAPCTPDDVAKALAWLERHPVVTWDVVRPVHGATMNQRDPMRFGATEVWHAAALQKELTEKYPEDAGFALLGMGEGLVARVRVEARDSQRALEIGDQKLGEFEAVLRFLGGAARQCYDFGIFTHQPEWTQIHAVISPRGWLHGSTTDGAMVEVDLDAEHLQKDKFRPAEALWAIHASKSRTVMEEKLMAGVHWLSRAMREPEAGISVAQSWFAIEAALPINEKERVSPQVRELSGLLMGVDEEGQQYWAKVAGNLYKVRCDVAHGRRHILSDAERIASLRHAESIIGVRPPALDTA